MQPTSPKVVLFDMDGVLYDSMPNHGIAWQRAMKEFGIHFTVEDSYATEGARGVDTIRKYAKAQLGKELTEEEAQKMYDLKAHYFHEMPEAKIFDGVTDLMKKIKDSGLKIGIVTGSAQRPLIERVTHDFGDFVSRDQITTAFDVKRGKPNPDPYLMGLKKAGNYAPSEGIVVENAPLGVRAGVAAGCYTVAINSGPLDDSVLINEGANILFPTIREFADNWEEVLNNISNRC
ncbi:HAD-IA family hydrolase [Prevotella histicola]|uniref:HAD family hydrolase n=1 Tax=Prevotella histicola TaxID=470565 RepID=UPI001C5D3952|nr:HAD-IA family hydrolase [Prevotella histicola]MBW4711699.1 HAD-IA family hydrolase [Prevotella histicola]MBW4876659.1 HAD-IA family hydrolase [Prevotella histicola]MBW4920234.1 HAD-IA family hydrolase [Prevotella histicola]